MQENWGFWKQTHTHVDMTGNTLGISVIWGKNEFVINSGKVIWVFIWRSIQLYFYHAPYTKANSKQIKDLNVQAKL